MQRSKPLRAALALTAIACVAGAQPVLARGDRHHTRDHGTRQAGRHTARQAGRHAAHQGRHRTAHQSRHRRHHRHRARTTGRVRVSDHGSLSYHSDTATAIIDTGWVYGTIPGHAQVHFNYNGSPTVTATFVIYAKGGTLYGRARCRLHNPTSRTPSFAGRLAITGGRGRYAHARGGGEMFGVFHRRGYGLVVHANGRLRI